MSAETVDTECLPIPIPEQARRGNLRPAPDAAARPAQRPATAPAAQDTAEDIHDRQLTLLECTSTALVPAPHAAVRRLLDQHGTVRAAAAAAGVPRTTFQAIARGSLLVTPAVRDRIERAVGTAANAFLEDVEWMLDTGESAAGIAARLGITHASLLRALGPDRHNRPDLVARLTTDSTGLSTGLCIPSRDRGRAGGGDGDPHVTAGQAAAVTRLVAARLSADAAADVLAMLGLAPAPARYGRT